jgi:hypothetical protein
MNRRLLVVAGLVALAACQSEQQSSGTAAQTVTEDNFVRAETDTYFAGFVKEGAFGKLAHRREVTPLDEQEVVRMNRDTVYSRGVFDLDAGPVTITLPDAGGRFMSVLAVNQDHYALGTYYDAAPHRFTRDDVGTRYLALLIRTFVDPDDPADLDKVHALQDAIRVEQPGGPGSFKVPAWDETSLTAVRQELNGGGSFDTRRAFGTREEVDPRDHLIGTARGWGGNPVRDATYVSGQSEMNDGQTVHRLTVKDVPVDGFWSVSVYNKDGFFEPNPQDTYSLNNVTAKKSADGSYTIQFGGCDGRVPNCLPITPGWNYTVRLYRPRDPIVDGQWSFPEAQPIG